MTKCNLKTGLVGLTAIALGTLAIVSTGQAGTPLPLPLKPFVIAAKPAAMPIAIQARPPLQPAVVAATPVIPAAGKLASIKVALLSKPATVVLPGAATSVTYPYQFNGVNGTRDDITVQPTPTGPGSFTSRIYGPGGQVLWTHYNSCRYGSPCGQPPMTGTATPVPPSPAATGATSAPTYSQSTINQANAVGTTPQNIVSLAQGHPGPGAPATFVEAKQTILPPGVHSSPPSGAHCSHGVRVTYLNGGNTGGTNGLAAGTQAWAYSCA